MKLTKEHDHYKKTVKSYFEKIEPIDTVEIKRAGKVMRYAFFYRLKKYNGTFINPIARQ